MNLHTGGTFSNSQGDFSSSRMFIRDGVSSFAETVQAHPARILAQPSSSPTSIWGGTAAVLPNYDDRFQSNGYVNSYQCSDRISTFEETVRMHPSRVVNNNQRFSSINATTISPAPQILEPSYFNAQQSIPSFSPSFVGVDRNMSGYTNQSTYLPPPYSTVVRTETPRMEAPRTEAPRTAQRLYSGPVYYADNAHISSIPVSGYSTLPTSSAYTTRVTYDDVGGVKKVSQVLCC
jgi:hypothetical protein